MGGSKRILNLLERKGDRERGKRECVSRKSVRAVRAQEKGEGKGNKSEREGGGSKREGEVSERGRGEGKKNQGREGERESPCGREGVMLRNWVIKSHEMTEERRDKDIRNGSYKTWAGIHQT